MSTTTTHPDPGLRRSYGAVCVCGLASAAIGAVWVGVAFGASVLLGVSIALGNLWVLSRAVRQLLGGAGNGSVSWSLVAVFKFFVLLGATYLLVSSPYVRPLGLCLGFLALPFGIVLGSLLQAPPRPDSGGRLNGETDHA